MKESFPFFPTMSDRLELSLDAIPLSRSIVEVRGPTEAMP